MNFIFRKLHVLAAALMFMPAIAFACFNGYTFHGTHGDGYNDIHGFEKLPERHFGKPETGDTLCRNYKDSSDYAVYLIKQGFLGRGLSMLVKLSSNYPREYVISANLGTAYELSGQNDSALKWIEYSLMLNPDAHEGTEWVHTDILKAKLAIAKDPNWLSTHHVLNINRINFGKTINGKVSESIQLRGILKAIYVQLTERLPFTAPGDLIMGDICADAAQIIESTSIEAGMAWWKLANEFGVPAVSPDPNERIKLLKEAGKKIPNLMEDVPIPIDDSGRRINPGTNFYHVNFLSFDKFSESKAWKLKDEELLNKVIADLQAPKAEAKSGKTDAPQATEKGISGWIWIFGGTVALLFSILVLVKRKP
ncbi:MAG: tetratricopeptide repeat protein [Bacteroidia bacterium]